MVEANAGQGLNVGGAAGARGADADADAGGRPARAVARSVVHVAASLLAAASLAGCAAFPVDESATPEAGQPEHGSGPELPPASAETAPDSRPDAQSGTVVPTPAPTPPPPPSYHPAGEALVEQARRESELGNDAVAGATLERALRIDGDNPWIWIELGHLRLEAGQRVAAESLARKALSLAARDPIARDAATTLLQQAGSGR